jgi:hypothetical protein
LNKILIALNFYTLRRSFIKLFSHIKSFGVRQTILKVLIKIALIFIQGLSKKLAFSSDVGINSSSKYTPKLPNRGVLEKSLIIIITDTKIDQCLTYRVHQKEHLLNLLGLPVKVFSSIDKDQLETYLPFAKAVVVYRTYISLEHIIALKSCGARQEPGRDVGH